MKVQDPSVDGEKLFKEKFVEEIKALTIENINKKMVLEMKDQGLHLVQFILPELDKMFEEYEVVSVEEALYEPITEFETDINFKGFIDLVIKTPDGKYHVIDWKTCSWGWRAERKAEPMTVYQLSFYKNYFAKKHGIDPKNVETYFALLKRTAKKDNVEIFRVTSGPKKTDNATTLLTHAVKNIEKQHYVKNRNSCTYCEFNNTEFCTR